MTSAVLKPSPLQIDPHTGIDDDNVEKLAPGLRAALSDTCVLLIKTRGYHWNVVGPLFATIHELTATKYEDLLAAADELAERIRALGTVAPMTYREMIAAAAVREHDTGTSAVEIVRNLANDHATLAERMRSVARAADERGDLVTSDLLVARMENHEKAASMLRAILSR